MAQHDGAPALAAEQLVKAAAFSAEQQPLVAQQPSTQHVGQAQTGPQHASQSAQQHSAAFEPAAALNDKPPRPRTTAIAANDK